MSEPTTTVVQGGASVVGGLIVLAGPELGPWLAVLAASFVGSLWTVGALETQTKWHAALVLLRTILTALVLTGAVAFVLVNYTSVPIEHVLPLTAFALGAWFEQLKDSALMRLRSLLGGTTQ